MLSLAGRSQQHTCIPVEQAADKSGYGMEVDWWQFGIVMAEVVSGRHPYAKSFLSRMASPDKLVKMSTSKMAKESASKHASPEFRSLMAGLLEPDPKKRLGGGGGDVEEIKSHPFFAGLDWDKVLRKGYEPVRLAPLDILPLPDDQEPEFQNPREVIASFDQLDKLLQFEL